LAELFATARAEGSRSSTAGVSATAGCFVEPTVILANSAADTLLNQETFGPVATFLPYDDEEQLLHLMNATPYGLSASLWSNDLGKAMRLIPEIQAGTLWVNMHPARPGGALWRHQGLRHRP
jgi:phenylacetaldehyde dehydrogenase